MLIKERLSSERDSEFIRDLVRAKLAHHNKFLIVRDHLTLIGLLLFADVALMMFCFIDPKDCWYFILSALPVTGLFSFFIADVKRRLSELESEYVEVCNETIHALLNDFDELP